MSYRIPEVQPERRPVPDLVERAARAQTVARRRVRTATIIGLAAIGLAIAGWLGKVDGPTLAVLLGLMFVLAVAQEVVLGRR